MIDPERMWVEFRAEEDHAQGLRLSYIPEVFGLDYFDVEVTAPGLSCRHTVLSYGGDGMSEFFAGLAADWRGWTGTRQWAAVESGMRIEATHRGNRVALVFTVRRDYKPDAWEIRLPLLVGPGEDLSRLARAISALFAV